MKTNLSFILNELWQGKSVLRAYLNNRLAEEILKGAVIDIGGGKNADYLAFMKRDEPVVFKTFDVKAGDTAVNFETDRLPADDGTFDTVLFLNVMEHIFNYQHIANEVVRITKPEGRLIGFVPFLMWYHADHRDFFRYTHEALETILATAGAKSMQIEMIGGGPFIAAAHMVLQSFPRFLRPVLFLKFYIADWLYKKLKGSGARPYALGYIFIVRNHA